MSIVEEIGEQLLLDTFGELLAYAERKTCLHEETHRGGTLWTICDSCGMKWADDKGGLSPLAHEWPEAIAKAQTLLDIVENRKNNKLTQNDKTSDTVSIVIPNSYIVT